MNDNAPCAPLTFEFISNHIALFDFSKARDENDLRNTKRIFVCRNGIETLRFLVGERPVGNHAVRPDVVLWLEAVRSTNVIRAALGTRPAKLTLVRNFAHIARNRKPKIGQL
jgi:hypothetical protein